jgi:hypothetical protein
MIGISMYKYISLVLLLLFAASCTAQPVKFSILDGSSCELPCWHGIVPGKTTKEEYLKLIENVSFEENQLSTVLIEGETENLFDGVIASRIESRRLLNVNLDLWIQAFWTSDNLIRYIEVCGDENKINTTIGDIFNESGPPEFIISGGNHLGGIDVVLVNPKVGESFWYQTNRLPENMQQIISPDIVIRCLDLFDTTMYQDMLEEGFFSMGYYNAEETLRVLYPWNGFGNLNEKYPPRQP